MYRHIHLSNTVVSFFLSFFFEGESLVVQVVLELGV